MMTAGRYYENFVVTCERGFHGENVSPIKRSEPISPTRRGEPISPTTIGEPISPTSRGEPVYPAKSRTGFVDEKAHRHY